MGDPKWLALPALVGLIGVLLLVRGLPLRLSLREMVRRRRSRRILAERLGKKAAPAPELPPPNAAPRERRNLLPRLTEFLTQTRARPLMAQLEQALVLARLPLKPAEFLWVSVASLFIALGLAALLTPNNVPLALLITLVAGFSPFYYLRISQQIRFNKVDLQVADTLLLMCNSLKAGASFLDAMDVVSHEMPPPISEEFARALRDVTLGIPTDEAFVRMSQRCRSEDLDLAVTAFKIQREVGGNLSEILENIAETIRERMKLRLEVRTLSTQGKMSGGILCVMPVLLTLVLRIMNPDYMSKLFTTAPGRTMLEVGIAMQVIGALAIRKIIRIDV